MADKKISALTAATTPLVGSEVLPIVQGASTVKVSVDNLTAGKAVSFLSSASGVGSAVAPSYAFTGGTATGMWSPAAGTIAFSVNGVEVTRILSSGNFGIGTTSPSTKLAVSTGVAGDIASFSDGIAQTIQIATGAGYAEIRNPNAGAIIFSNPTSRMTISAAGNITADTGNIVIGTANKGIDFSVNPAAPGMTSELLNDYEEGTWTPSFTSTGLSAVYGQQTGMYTKVGRLVTASAYILVNSTSGTLTNALYISGLPFATPGGVEYGFSAAFGVYQFTGVTPTGFMGALDTRIQLYQAGTVTPLTGAVLAPGYYLVTVTYSAS